MVHCTVVSTIKLFKMDPNPRKALRRKGLESESRKRSGKRSGMSVKAVFPFLHIYVVCVCMYVRVHVMGGESKGSSAGSGYHLPWNTVGFHRQKNKE